MVYQAKPSHLGSNHRPFVAEHRREARAALGPAPQTWCLPHRAAERGAGRYPGRGGGGLPLAERRVGRGAGKVALPKAPGASAGLEPSLASALAKKRLLSTSLLHRLSCWKLQITPVSWGTGGSPASSLRYLLLSQDNTAASRKTSQRASRTRRLNRVPSPLPPGCRRLSGWNVAPGRANIPHRHRPGCRRCKTQQGR